MKQFRLNGKPYALATSWADVTPAQLVRLAPFLYAEPTARVKLDVLRLLCPGVLPRLLRKLTGEQAWELLQEINWIWQEELTGAQLTHFRHRGLVYLLPEPSLTDGIALEYAMANVYFRQFAHPTRPAPKALDQLVATLCRPERAGLDVTDPNWDGQRRERYNGKLAEARAALLADLPIGTKIVVLQHFLAAQRFVHRSYKALYKASTAAAVAGAPARPSDGTEVLEMIHALAERGTYGTYEETAYTGIHTLFFNLAKQAQRRREEE